MMAQRRRPTHLLRDDAIQALADLRRTAAEAEAAHLGLVGTADPDELRDEMAVVEEHLVISRQKEASRLPTYPLRPSAEIEVELRRMRIDLDRCEAHHPELAERARRTAEARDAATDLALDRATAWLERRHADWLEEREAMGTIMHRVPQDDPRVERIREACARPSVADQGSRPRLLALEAGVVPLLDIPVEAGPEVDADGARSG